MSPACWFWLILVALVAGASGLYLGGWIAYKAEEREDHRRGD